MPFTPFHFGPGALIALPLRRFIDLPLFVLANVAIDIEPLLVMFFNLSYPLHGHAHTFSGATIIGLCIGGIAFILRGYFKIIMEQALKLEYSSSLKKYLISGVSGCWFHVLLDSPLYADIKPFFPFTSANPLSGLIQQDTMYRFCAYAFIPALAIYLIILFIQSKSKNGL